MTKNEQINERLEQLLNKAGSTLEGLPKEYSCDQCVSAIHMAFEAFPDAQMESGSYICHLADIIDRFEVALNNVLVERDALLNDLRESTECCSYCKHLEDPISCNWIRSAKVSKDCWEWKGVDLDG